MIAFLSNRKVDFFRHSIGKEEKDKVLEALDGVFLTTGDYTCEVERLLSSYLKVKNVVALSSCTGALHLTLVALGVGPGDEVITTPLTFVATINAILMCGARPVLADVDKTTGNLDPGAVERKITLNTKAIIPVHLYGLMCDMDAFAALSDRYGIPVIEDSAHCIEAVREGTRPAGQSKAACFSFYATKNITCGEGGAVATNDHELAEKIRILAQHGITKNASERHKGNYQHWDSVCLGWKYNLDNIRSALLIPQIKKMDLWRRRRSSISKRYESAFEHAEGLGFPKVMDENWSARHLFTIWIRPSLRDDFILEIQRKGVGVVVNYRAVHLLTYYAQSLGYSRGDFPIAELIGDSTVSIPLYPGLKDDDVDYVIQTVIGTLGELRAKYSKNSKTSTNQE